MSPDGRRAGRYVEFGPNFDRQRFIGVEAHIEGAFHGGGQRDDLGGYRAERV